MGDLNDQSTDVSLHDEATDISATIEKDEDGKGRVFVDANIPDPVTDQQILTVLSSIRDELKKLNFKFNMVYELDKLDDTEAQ